MSVAQRYGKALYESLMSGNGSSDSVNKYFQQLRDLLLTFNSSPDAHLALFGNVTSSSDKVSILSALLDKVDVSPVIKKFLMLLARKGRLSLFPEVVARFEQIAVESEGGVYGEVLSPEELTDQDQLALTDAFERKLGRKVRLKSRVQEDLLAGVRVTVDGVTYDSSLAAQFDRLEQLFLSDHPATS